MSAQRDLIVKLALGLVGVAIPFFSVKGELGVAQKGYEDFLIGNSSKPPPKTAAMAEDQYCSPHLKSVVRRVAGSCGLIENDASGGRGCQPMQAQSVAQLSGEDFNSLFTHPAMKPRAHIVQFSANEVELDALGQAEVEKAWGDQRGASFFFVVSRASPDGKDKVNEQLSAERAQNVLEHLQNKFKDKDLKKQVGLLWLGEGFAQLDTSFCAWSRSRAGTEEPCTEKEINRSAFVAWIDCQI
ncbi:MAG: hypothetical protein ACOYM9_23460 [Bradymonadia bacterium]|jgi:hypothetical protein